jgi:predicted transcriptional regulator of viral defense system
MASPDSQPKSYSLAAGVALAAELAKQGRLVFTTQQARQVAGDLQIPESGVGMLLTRLADAGWVIRLRRGLYAGTGRLPGGVDVPPFVLATALVEPSAVALWSALAHHDLTDQVPVAITAITPRKVITPSMRAPSTSRVRHAWHVAGLECRFVTLTESRYEIGIERVWADERFAFLITDRERTVLDTFAMPRHFGGFSEGLAVLDRALATLDVDKLIHYARQYGSRTLVKRLGWSLERAGADRSVLIPLLEVPSTSYSVLDPRRPRRGDRDRRWKLILNMGAESGRG